MKATDWQASLPAITNTIVRATDGAIYIFMSSKELGAFHAAMSEAGAHWSDTIICVKNAFVLGRPDYQRQYEPIWYGWREGATHYWCGDRSQSDVWEFDRPGRSVEHPTMKPVALLMRAIENSSQPGDTIFDPCAGRGSTLIAAERTGRRCRAIEIEPAYCDVIIKRWEAFSGKQAVRLPRAAEAG